MSWGWLLSFHCSSFVSSVCWISPSDSYRVSARIGSGAFFLLRVPFGLLRRISSGICARFRSPKRGKHGAQHQFKTRMKVKKRVFWGPTMINLMKQQTRLLLSRISPEGGGVPWTPRVNFATMNPQKPNTLKEGGGKIDPFSIHHTVDERNPFCTT